MKKFLTLKLIHIFFNKVLKSLPKENQRKILSNLENIEKENSKNSKNYLYIVVAIFITVSAVILIYKNKGKIKSFLHKAEKKSNQPERRPPERPENEESGKESILEWLYYFYEEYVPKEVKSAINDISNRIYPYLCSLKLNSLKSFYETYCPSIIQRGIDMTMTYLGPFIIYPVGAVISQVIGYVSAITENRYVEPFFQWFRSMTWSYFREAIAVVSTPVLLIRDIILNPVRTWNWILRVYRGVGGHRTPSGVLQY